MNFVKDQILEDFFKSLSNETRRNILFLFFDGKPKTVNEVSQKASISQSTASEYLKQLKRSGLLLSKREGKSVFYYPDGKKIRQILAQLGKYLAKCC